MITINDQVSFYDAGYNRIVILVDSAELDDGSLDVYGDVNAIRTLVSLCERPDTEIIVKYNSQFAKYGCFFSGYNVEHLKRNTGGGDVICAGIACPGREATGYEAKYPWLSVFRIDYSEDDMLEDDGRGYCEFGVHYNNS